MPSRFDRDTAASPVGNGVFDTRIDEGWWIDRGPNGGYMAGCIMQAFLAEVGTASSADEQQYLRSVTTHYLAPPVAGPARVHIVTERSGRLVRFLSARLVQHDKLIATAQAVFGRTNPNSPAFADPTFPGYPQPGEMEHVPDPAGMSEMRSRYEYLHAIGAPWDEPGEAALTGGWIRLREPRPYDAALITAMCDAWHPPVFSRLRDPMGVPTLDLTVHLRSVEAMQRLCPDDWVAVRFRTTTSAEGYLEEDGHIWAPDGTLIAHSRQLSILLAF